MTFRVAVLAPLLALAGCGGFPQNRESTLDQKQRENVAQKATSEFAQAVQPTPLQIKLQDGTTISQPAASQVTARAEAGENSDSAAFGASTSSVRLPLSIALLIGAVALILIIIAVWLILKYSSAAKAAWTYGNDALERIIKGIRANQAAETDPKITAALEVAATTATSEQVELNKPL